MKKERIGNEAHSSRFFRNAMRAVLHKNQRLGAEVAYNHGQNCCHSRLAQILERNLQTLKIKNMSAKQIKTGLLAMLLGAGMVSFSFSGVAGGSVRGTVTPVEGGLRAFLFSAKDTLSVNVNSGSFQFSNVAAGSYKLLVEAAPPYRNAVKDGISVTEGEFTDAGQVELQK